ncbi:MAG: hypothetical protein ACR2JY_16630 [Chloroflexota bacterium]
MPAFTAAPEALALVLPAALLVVVALSVGTAVMARGGFVAAGKTLLVAAALVAAALVAAALVVEAGAAADDVAAEVVTVTLVAPPQAASNVRAPAPALTTPAQRMSWRRETGAALVCSG